MKRPKAKPYRPKECAEQRGIQGKCVRMDDGRYQLAFFVNGIAYVEHANDAGQAWHQACLRWDDIPQVERTRELNSRQ